MSTSATPTCTAASTAQQPWGHELDIEWGRKYVADNVAPGHEHNIRRQGIYITACRVQWTTRTWTQEHNHVCVRHDWNGMEWKRRDRRYMYGRDCVACSHSQAVHVALSCQVCPLCCRSRCCLVCVWPLCACLSAFVVCLMLSFCLVLLLLLLSFCCVVVLLCRSVSVVVVVFCCCSLRVCWARV
jgi:hypothetical protein